MGNQREIDLIAGGSKVDVTSQNKYVIIIIVIVIKMIVVMTTMFNIIIFMSSLYVYFYYYLAYIIHPSIHPPVYLMYISVFITSSILTVVLYYRHRYINLTAKYYLYDRLKLQSKAFFRFDSIVIIILIIIIIEINTHIDLSDYHQN